MSVMNLEQLETEALKLEPGLRAKLAERLFLSLEPLSAEESLALWTEEAQRRDDAMDRDPSLSIPADDVFRRVQPRLKH